MVLLLSTWPEIRSNLGGMRPTLPLRCSLVCAAAVFGLALAQAGVGDDPDVKAAKEKAEAAESQTDRNITSKAVCDALDVKLKEVEGKIRERLDAGGKSLFDAAAAAWRNYRSAQVKFEGSFYEGGSIQPLVHNQAYSAITETHVDDLIRFKEESIDDR